MANLLRIFLISLVAIDAAYGAAFEANRKDSEHLTPGPNDYKLVILHVNDMHSRVEPINGKALPVCKEGETCFGGFARIKYAADQLRADYEKKGWNVLFLNAGDNFQGSPYFTVHGWSVFEDLLPRMNFDAMCLGNHEFDNGPKFLYDYLHTLKVNEKKLPILASNVYTDKEEKFEGSHIESSTIITKGGKKIGIIGYVTPDTMTLCNPGKIYIGKEVEAITKEVGFLKRKGVDIIIGLGHSGYEKDLEIAREVIDMDVVVGGHTNTMLFKGDKPSTENIDGIYPTLVEVTRVTEEGEDVKVNVPVVQAYAYTKYIGVLELTFNNAGLTSAVGNPVLMSTDKWKEDEDMVHAISKWKKAVDESYHKVISQTEVELDGVAAKCRVGECNLGNLVADAFANFNVDEENSVLKGKTLISFIQSGSIRASIPKGPVSYGDLQLAFPFNNEVRAVKVRGETILKSLEHSVSNYEPGRVSEIGTFLQVSGMKIEYDVYNDPGQRVKKVLVKCNDKEMAQNPDCKTLNGYAPLKMRKKYYLVTINELINGRDGFVDLKNNHRDIEGFGRSQLETLERYLKRFQNVNPVIEERTVIRREINVEMGQLFRSSTAQQIITYASSLFSHVRQLTGQ